jgi:hypothetical protein
LRGAFSDFISERENVHRAKIHRQLVKMYEEGVVKERNVRKHHLVAVE